MTKTPSKQQGKPVPGDGNKQQTRDERAAGLPPGPGAHDRPGFDIGGAVTDKTAGKGLGLGVDAAEDGVDQRLRGRKGKVDLGFPRFGGATKRDK